MESPSRFDSLDEFFPEKHGGFLSQVELVNDSFITEEILNGHLHDLNLPEPSVVGLNSPLQQPKTEETILLPFGKEEISSPAYEISPPSTVYHMFLPTNAAAYQQPQYTYNRFFPTDANSNTHGPLFASPVASQIEFVSSPVSLIPSLAAVEAAPNFIGLQPVPTPRVAAESLRGVASTPLYFFPQNPPTIRIFYDKDLKEEVPRDIRLNKDLIVIFLLENVFPPNSNVNYQMVTDPAVLFESKRKPLNPTAGNPYGILHATLVDEDNIPMQLCPTCEKMQGTKIFSIRSVQQHGRHAKVSASVACSGNPTSSSRLLKVDFEVRAMLSEGGYVVAWRGTSTQFAIYHHRGKRATILSTVVSPPEETKIPSSRAIIHQHKLLKPTGQAIDIPFLVNIHSSTQELYGFLSEVTLADSTSQNELFCESSIHFTLLVADELYAYIAEKAGDYKIILPRVTEFILSVCEIFRSMTNDRHANPVGAQNRATFHISKAAGLSQQMMIGPHAKKWIEVLSYYWQCLFSGIIGLKGCACIRCYYSHIACIIQLSRAKGVTKKELATSLNELNIPTKQGKKWHTSLNGLLKKPGRMLGQNVILNPKYSNLLTFTLKYYTINNIMEGVKKNLQLICCSTGGAFDYIRVGQNPQLREAFIQRSLQFPSAIGPVKF
eukprot:TRINITY_DN2990_c0_g2_i2.p1 TRINITY_DN2990_c0_g2~~TRINITY_DN2990_c0_g2_i2.p1  ORF type:complete len:663 (-),score=100.67 TRINITY_DN2990_c0_g2_i2:29-2017(-)